jgi:threonine synthase
MPFSYFRRLACAWCGARHDASRLVNVCAACGKSLAAEYDLTAARRSWTRGDWPKLPGMWKFAPVLPARSAAEVVSLGEGATPMLEAPALAKKLGIRRLWIKEEGVNPTGSFKARGMSAAVTMAKSLGAKHLCVPTAGNAGGACAAYAARAGLKATIYLPKDAPQANLVEIRAAGAKAVLVDGVISDAAARMREEMKSTAMFDVSTLKEPYRVEGKKTMGYEIAESLGWRLPTVILYPAGGGTGLIGMWRAFHEMKALGWIRGRFPRMVAVQAAGCAPLVASMRTGRADCVAPANPSTIAAGLRVPRAFADWWILRILRESGGDAVSVTDAELKRAIGGLFASTGVFFCPEGAACWPAACRLKLRRDDEVVLFNTGTGLKYLDVVGRP